MDLTLKKILYANIKIIQIFYHAIIALDTNKKEKQLSNDPNPPDRNDNL